MSDQVTELRAALGALGALNRAETWAGVEIELNDLRRRELAAVLGDVEAALGSVRELLDLVGVAAEEFIQAHGLADAGVALWAAEQVIYETAETLAPQPLKRGA